MPRTIIDEIPGVCRVYDDGTILFQNVRFSYAHADAPYAPKNKPDQAKKYSVVGLVPKKTHKGARDLTKKFVDNMLLEKGSKGKPVPMASKDKFFRDGDDSGKEETVGMWTVNCSASPDDAPSVRGPDTRPISSPEEVRKKVKSGYWGDILVKPWFQDNEHGKKVNAQFIAIQVKKKDEVFGGEGRVSEEDIDETFDAADEDEFENDVDSDDDDGGL